LLKNSGNVSPFFRAGINPAPTFVFSQIIVAAGVHPRQKITIFFVGEGFQPSRKTSIFSDGNKSYPYICFPQIIVAAGFIPAKNTPSKKLCNSSVGAGFSLSVNYPQEQPLL
jgi:hypothetical protein